MLRCTCRRASILLCILLHSHAFVFAAAPKAKRGILGLDVAAPLLPAPFGPPPFAPFGVGSPFAPPFALPFPLPPAHPPPFPAPFPASFPLTLPVFPPPPFYAPPYYPPPFYPSPVYAPSPPPPLLPPPPAGPARPAALPPAPIIVPAKTAAALSIASIIHALIARKFYPPVVPFPIANPVPFPVPVRVPVPAAVERPVLVPAKRHSFLSSPHAENPPFEVHGIMREEVPAAEQETEELAAFPTLPSTEEPWRPQFIPLHDE